MRDKSYRAFPMGLEAGAYLRWKRGRLTQHSYDAYESCLDKLARFFPDLELKDFQPPVGAQRLDEFMEAHWGSTAARTYNKNLSIIKDFFKWSTLRGELPGDPTLALNAHKPRDTYRETFSDDHVTRIISSQESVRDRLCLRLLLIYGLRKGALRAVQLKHFDHNRRRLTIFTKGEKVRELPIVQQEFWLDLERHILDVEAQPHFYLLNRSKQVFWKYDERGRKLFRTFEYHDEPKSPHGAHDWWYECLERAGIVAKGVRRGEKMHKSRHTAGQRVLDRTHGNLKAAQKLLGHASIQTTADIYTDWDIDALAETMKMIDGD